VDTDYSAADLRGQRWERRTFEGSAFTDAALDDR